MATIRNLLNLRQRQARCVGRLASAEISLPVLQRQFLGARSGSSLSAGRVAHPGRRLVIVIVTAGAVLALGLLAAPIGHAAAGGLEEIELFDVGGTPTPLGDTLKHEPAILHLWATWCAPCREELPAVGRFAAELARSGLEDRLIVISTDQGPFERVADFLHELGLDSLHSWQVSNGSPGTVLQVLSYPTTLLLDGEGIVVERRSGSLDWDDAALRHELLAHIRGAGEVIPADR